MKAGKAGAVGHPATLTKWVKPNPDDYELGDTMRVLFPNGTKTVGEVVASMDMKLLSVSGTLYDFDAFSVEAK